MSVRTGRFSARQTSARSAQDQAIPLQTSCPALMSGRPAHLFEVPLTPTRSFPASVSRCRPWDSTLDSPQLPSFFLVRRLDRALRRPALRAALALAGARPSRGACRRAGVVVRPQSACRPRCVRVFSITGCSRIAAMIPSSPPLFGQCSGSISKTRFSSLDQLSRTGRWYAQFALHSAGSVPARVVRVPAPTVRVLAAPPARAACGAAAQVRRFACKSCAAATGQARARPATADVGQGRHSARPAGALLTAYAGLV